MRVFRVDEKRVYDIQMGTQYRNEILGSLFPVRSQITLGGCPYKVTIS